MTLRFAAVCAMVLMPAAASADPLSVRAAGPTQLSWTIGRTFDTPLRVYVEDEWGSAAEGALVTFAAPASGASATLSAFQVATGEDGLASVIATANATIGVYSVTASVAGSAGTVTFTLSNVAPGFRPGEQLASVIGADQQGKIRNIRDFLDGGKSYALIEVCTFCPECRFSETEAPIAIARLADRKISANLVPILWLGFPGPATQTDAAAWKAELGLKGPVLHSSGSTSSDLYRAGESIVGFQGLWPTTLLVAPDGTIIDRRAGAVLNASGFEAWVLRAVLAAGHPVSTATAADVVVNVGRQALRGTAAPTLTGPLGRATFEAHIRELLAEDSEFTFEAASPLPDAALQLAIAPIWPDGFRRSSAGSAVLTKYLSVLEGNPVELANLLDGNGTPVTYRSGTFSLEFDVTAFRIALAPALHAYADAGYITHEQADAVVRDVYGVTVQLEAIIDLRLKGSTR